MWLQDTYQISTQCVITRYISNKYPKWLQDTYQTSWDELISPRLRQLAWAGLNSTEALQANKLIVLLNLLEFQVSNLGMIWSQYLNFQIILVLSVFDPINRSFKFEQDPTMGCFCWRLSSIGGSLNFIHVYTLVWSH
jgi:hypothetical protein